MAYRILFFNFFLKIPRLKESKKKNNFEGTFSPYISGSIGLIISKNNMVHPWVDTYQSCEFHENWFKNALCILCFYNKVYFVKKKKKKKKEKKRILRNLVGKLVLSGSSHSVCVEIGRFVLQLHASTGAPPLHAYNGQRFCVYSEFVFLDKVHFGISIFIFINIAICKEKHPKQKSPPPHQSFTSEVEGVRMVYIFFRNTAIKWIRKKIIYIKYVMLLDKKIHSPSEDR